MQLSRKAAPRLKAPLLGLATLAALGLAAAPAQAQVSGTSSGVFSGYTAGTDNPSAAVSGVGTSTLEFGATLSTANEFSFAGGGFSTAFGTPFNVGTFTYANGATVLGTNIDSANLKTTLVFTAPGGLGTQSFTYDIPVTVTPNSNDPVASADFIKLPVSQPAEVFTYGGTTYTLQLSGFNTSGLTSSDGFLANSGTELHVYEGHTASAGITGTLTESTATPEPSSVAAFAFTGLGAMGLMLKARKRKPVA